MGAMHYIRCIHLSDLILSGLLILVSSQFKWAENVQRLRTEEALESKRQQEKYIDPIYLIFDKKTDYELAALLT